MQETPPLWMVLFQKHFFEDPILMFKCTRIYWDMVNNNSLRMENSNFLNFISVGKLGKQGILTG